MKFIPEAERKKIREDIMKALNDGTCQSRYEIAVMNVVIRLLDTVDHFVEANYKLSQRNTDLELAVVEDMDNEKKLNVDEKLNLVWGVLDEMVDRMEKLEARVTKKKIVKKTTLKRKK